MLIEYGDECNPHRILVDGGIAATGKEHLLPLVRDLQDGAVIDLLVVTHIDQDHIEGIVELLNDAACRAKVRQVWFNGSRQLSKLDAMGVKEGLELSNLLEAHFQDRWNIAAGGERLCLTADGSPVTLVVPGPMECTLLSPDLEGLRRLKAHWDSVARGIREEQSQAPTPQLGGRLKAMGTVDINQVRKWCDEKSTEDSTIANGSSIALLLKSGERSLLMLADAHPRVLKESLRRLGACKNKPLYVDAVKVSHHGSRGNLDVDLAELIESPNWIFSSDGTVNTKHPHPQAVARALVASRPRYKTLHFNYRTEAFNALWDNPEWCRALDYTPRFGTGKNRLTVRLLN